MNSYSRDAAGLQAWWAARQQADSIEWIRISAETGEWLRGLTGHDDLLAEVEPGNSMGHPAIYRPEHAAVEINPDICAPGIPPSTISMHTEAGRLGCPSLAGAACHEGSHKEFSRWPIDQSPGKRAVMVAALLLEEAAAEGGYEATNALFAPAAGRALVEISLVMLQGPTG